MRVNVLEIRTGTCVSPMPLDLLFRVNFAKFLSNLRLCFSVFGKGDHCIAIILSKLGFIPSEAITCPQKVLLLYSKIQTYLTEFEGCTFGVV